MSMVVLLAAGAMLVAGLGALLARRVPALAWLLAAQGAGLATALAAMASEHASGWLLALATATLLAKAAAPPRLGPWLSHRLAEPGPAGGRLATAGVAVTALVLAAAAPVLRPEEAVALAVLALGTLALAGRTDLAGQVAGVVALENGLVLLLAAAGAPPGLALASAVLPAAAVAALLRHVLAAR